MTIIVGITGGIGSGKSTFSNQVLNRKLKLFDSDEQVSAIYKKPNKKFLDYLRKIGLSNCINRNEINKKQVREIIFSNNLIKIKLEKYIFKIIRKKRTELIKREKRKKTNIIFFDVPLLLENNLINQFDIIISIISKKEERFKRIKNKKNLSKEIFNKIIKSQTTDKKRKEKSNIVIYNNRSKKNFIIKVNDILNNIIP